MTLRKELVDDVWKILVDKEEIPEKSENKFKFLVLQLLLESKGFRLGDAFQLADDLEERYNKILKDIDKYMEKGNGELLNVLENVKKYYDEQIEPLIKRIKRYGDN